MIWVRRLVIVLTLLVAAVLVYGLTLPDTTRVERTITIDRPAATVFAQLNDFRRFQLWSPWADKAPEVTTVEFSGPERGVGAVMRWESESPEVGSGQQTITVSEPHSRIETALVFDEFGENTAGYNLTAAPGGGTEVSWWFYQEHGWNLAGRLIGSMLDEWVGADYETGLARLKTLAESLPAEDFGELDVSDATLEPQVWLIRETSSAPTAAAVSEALGTAFFEIVTTIQENGLERRGQPIRLEQGFNGAARFAAAIPIAESDGVSLDGAVKMTAAYAGPALKAIHKGPYPSLADTHAKLRAYAAALGYETAGDLWESYVSDPGSIAESELITEVFLPVNR
ncbi:MAG: SRPBCC family protein [Pseudomonadota bacterium]